MFNGVPEVTGLGGFYSGETVQMKVNVTTRKAWWKVGSGDWNNNPTDNPDTGAGGYDFSAHVTGDIYITAATYTAGVVIVATF